MASDSDQDPEPEWLRNLPLRSEEIGFSANELIECKKCGKTNAPNRAACLYCGAALGGAGIAKLEFRELESWEKGFNVVVVDASRVDVDKAALQLEALVGTDRETLKPILTAGAAIPLKRVESESQASALSKRLVDLGIKTVVIPDESLQPASPPTRLRSIGFGQNQFKIELFNTGETRLVDRGEIVLIVTGIILEGRTEALEKRTRKGAKTLSETETSSDQMVIDLYLTGDPIGLRIPMAGFDFSCLGRDKSLIAVENMQRLTTKLSEFAPSARLVDDYVKVRSILEYSWPSELRRDTQQRGLDRKEISKIFTTNNTMQFTKYSRLQWQLYEKEV